MAKKLTPFQVKVLRTVLEIPFAQVRSYKWVAKKIGTPAAARAVGHALNKNPFPLFIPCHRVVASNGKIGGYKRGINAKKRLLNLEKKIYNNLNPKSNAKI